MWRKFGLVFLVICFGLLSVNAGLAAEIVHVQPIVVQPYDLREINQQILQRDRDNRNQELAIKGLIDDNERLSNTALARRENSALEEVNASMAKYRDSLLARDRARIMENATRESKYHDLIQLTENVQDSKGVSTTLLLKKDVIEDKYKVLNDLKEQMLVLNEKLKKQELSKNFEQISKQQEDKIKILTERLSQIDVRIERYDALLFQKDQQIAELKISLERINADMLKKDGMIKEQEQQIRSLISQIKHMTVPITSKLELPPIIVNAPLSHPEPLPQLNVKPSDNKILLSPIIVNRTVSPVQEAPKVVTKVLDKNIFVSPIVVNPAVVEKPATKTPVVKSKSKIMALPPIIVMAPSKKEQAVVVANFPDNAQIKKFEDELAQKQSVIDRLKEDLAKSEADDNRLEDKVNLKDDIIKEQVKQIEALKAQIEVLSQKEEQIKVQSDQIAQMASKYKDQQESYSNLESELAGLKNRVHRDDEDLRVKNDKIRWLNQVVAVAKSKAEYFRVTAEQELFAMKNVQAEVRNIKDDFTTHFSNYHEFETAIEGLKGQVNRLSTLLVQKENQAIEDIKIKEDLKDKLQQQGQDLLKANALKVSFNQDIQKAKSQHDADARLLEDLKKQLLLKENQIAQMKTDIKAMAMSQANKEEYFQKASVKVNERVQLARQLIQLQAEEALLLDQKTSLANAKSNMFDQHALSLEKKIKELAASYKLQVMDLQGRIESLEGLVKQKQTEIDALKKDLQLKIAQSSNAHLLNLQINDYKNQLELKDKEINKWQAKLHEVALNQQTQDSLKTALRQSQEKVLQLRQALTSKEAEAQKVSVMMAGYQEKLESKDNAYNQQLASVLAVKKNQVNAQMHIEILSRKVHDKEAQLIKLKQDLQEAQALSLTKSRDIQAHDLDVSMQQQKSIDQKIKAYEDKINAMHASNVHEAVEIKTLKTELALARQQLEGMPSIDEIEFLKTGLSQATARLKQRDQMLAEIQANAKEYAKAFKTQSQEFQTLKQQLEEAQQTLESRSEDLKYKSMEIIRLKERSTSKEKDLQKQLTTMTQKYDLAKRQWASLTHENKVKALESQLQKADIQIKKLTDELRHLKFSSQDDPLELKLTQALAKIDQQGRVIAILNQKLQDAGQNVDVVHVK